MEEWKQLETKRRNLQIVRQVFYVVMGIGVLIYYWNPVIGITLGVAGIAGALLIGRPGLKAFRDQIRRRMVDATCKGLLSDVQWQPRKGVPLAEIENSGLVWLRDHGKGYVGRELITARRGERAYMQSDISLLRRQYADEEMGKKNFQYIIGTWIHVECGRQFPTKVELIHRDFLPEEEAARFFAFTKVMLPADSGDQELNRQYHVYASDPAAAAALLTPAVTGHIRKIQELAGRPILVGMAEDKLYVILQSRFLSAGLDLRKPLPEGLLTARRLPELAEILALSDLLSQS